MKTNHIHFVDASNKVYCYRYDLIVKLTQKFHEEDCQRCPFYNGDVQGKGVECKYADGSNLPMKQYSDSHDAETEARALRAKVLKGDKT